MIHPEKTLNSAEVARPTLAADRTRSLDPRTRCWLVLLTSTVIMMPGGEMYVPAALILGVLLAALERAWRRMWVVPAVAGVLIVASVWIPALWAHPTGTAVGALCAFLVRFIAIGGVAAHFAATTAPGELGAALRAMRVPRAVTVPATVMVRFTPVVMAEARAVLEAMRLRGYLDTWQIARHPAHTLQRLTVPLIASSLRVADDLSAAALMRGLGAANTRPTTMYPLRFTAWDAACLGTIVLLALLTRVGSASAIA